MFSTVIASRLARNNSPAFFTAGSMTRSSRSELRAEIVWIGGAQRHRRADDFADRDAPTLAGEFVPAPRSAHALENLGVNEPLEQSLQVAGGSLWRAAKAFAATGADLECSATSTTAAMARTLRRDSRFILILLRRAPGGAKSA